ncbi:BLUF domain-containing protein [Antarctobacter jejuensis]|uniref:BLUF domain-containing protein n=1 Tax=Antarctobacter jejuensis TaxID=1439938 RepID=UPI003FD5BBD9
MQIIQLYYTSEALHPSGAKTDTEILDVARTKNPQSGVTGFLLRAQHRFAQILEGPEDAVMTLFESIRKDPRHKGIRHIVRRSVSDRSFPEWSMGYVARDDVLAASLVNFMPDDDADFLNLIARLRSISQDPAQPS